MEYSTEEQEYLERYRGKILVLVGMYGSESVSQLKDILRVVEERITNDWNQLPKHVLEAQKTMLQDAISELSQ